MNPPIAARGIFAMKAIASSEDGAQVRDHEYGAAIAFLFVHVDHNRSDDSDDSDDSDEALPEDRIVVDMIHRGPRRFSRPV